MKKLNLNHFENYLITSDGKIFNTLNRRGYPNSSNQYTELKSYANKNTGYMMVVLRNSKKSKPSAQYVHRLVAQTYIPNLENKPAVNHKDGNKLNNHVSNLEWVTPLENMNHAWEIGLSNFESLNKKTNAIRSNKVLLDKGLQHYKLYQNLSFVQKMWSLKSQHIVKKLLVENGIELTKNNNGRKYQTGAVSPFIEEEIKNYFISIFKDKNNKIYKSPSEYVLYIKQKYLINFSLSGYYRIRLLVKKELQNTN